MSTHVVINGQNSIPTTNTDTNSLRSAHYPAPTAKYEDVVQSSDLFWSTLKDFHNAFGTKFKVPTVGGRALDLHRLFIEVTHRGGLEKVVRDRKWKEVIGVFNFPTTITSASFVLRKYYLQILYHFEQVYYLGKEVPSSSFADSDRGSLDNDMEEAATANQPEGQGGQTLQDGASVIGVIDGKFDSGYLVTVNLGSEQLKGIVYHLPETPYESQNLNKSVARAHRRRKRSRLALQDPSRPKSNRSGYNFFFAEHYARLKPHYHGQERAISKKIGVLWGNLTEAEKQVYQEKGVQDKERYKSEMLEYRSSYDSAAQ